MKSKILRLSVFAIFLIIGILFSAFKLTEKDEKTFLENYEGTLWKYGEVKDGLTIYAKINRSETEPFELWLYNVIDQCYFYERYSESASTEVIENLNNSVRLKIKENEKEHGIFTLTIHGNSLSVNLDSFKDGELIKEEYFTLKKSNDKISDLKICEN